MNLLFSVPYLNDNGGIQTFAKTVYSSLKNSQRICILNSEPSLTTLWLTLLNIIPSNIASKLYYKFSGRKSGLKTVDADLDLMHFWHVECAIPNTHLNYIVSCYGVEILSDNIPKYKKNYYIRVFKYAKRIHVCSYFTKKLLIKNFNLPDSKIETIYSPIEYNKISKIGKRRHPRLVIGTLSRLVPRKNIVNIVRALEILMNKYQIDFDFFLAGDGPSKKDILSKLSQSDLKYRYFGAISDSEKFNYFYPSIDVFVLPTVDNNYDIEGFGIVYIEANSYGIPVIASRVGGVEEAVKEKESGLFTDPNNPNDIADKIFTLINTRKSYFISAKIWAKQFDTRVISKQFIQLYRKCIGNLED